MSLIGKVPCKRWDNRKVKRKGKFVVVILNLLLPDYFIRIHPQLLLCEFYCWILLHRCSSLWRSDNFTTVHAYCRKIGGQGSGSRLSVESNKVHVPWGIKRRILRPTGQATAAVQEITLNFCVAVLSLHKFNWQKCLPKDWDRLADNKAVFHSVLRQE